MYTSLICNLISIYLFHAKSHKFGSRIERAPKHCSLPPGVRHTLMADRRGRLEEGT